MSLFIVNFHWQTYSYNISFQAQRLERLRKERQNQIKCKNVQWKDRNTSYSGKKKRPSIFLLFLFLLLMVIAFSVHNFSLQLLKRRGKCWQFCLPSILQLCTPHGVLVGGPQASRLFSRVTGHCTLLIRAKQRSGV